MVHLDNWYILHHGDLFPGPGLEDEGVMKEDGQFEGNEKHPQ